MPRIPARQRLIRNTFLMVSALYLSGYDAAAGDDDPAPGAVAERAEWFEETSGPVVAVTNAAVKKNGAA